MQYAGAGDGSAALRRGSTKARRERDMVFANILMGWVEVKVGFGREEIVEVEVVT